MDESPKFSKGFKKIFLWERKYLDDDDDDDETGFSIDEINNMIYANLHLSFLAEDILIDKQMIR